ncbi:MAG: DUF3943 domain-containing protein [Gemmatimonas sp.]|nr:DUF3943 domain-containing protein [Gemmatimonadaceae bacterium]
MDSDGDKRSESLGTVLVASSDTGFADAVGRLVAESRYTPAFPTGLEAPWLSVTRTQPRAVICDSDAPVTRLRRLIAEVAARRVPLLMAYSGEKHGNPVALTLVERVSWHRFPVSAEELGRILAAAVPPDSDRGAPHEDKPSEAERQYRVETTPSVDPFVLLRRSFARRLSLASLLIGMSIHTASAQSAPAPLPTPNPALRADTSARRSNVVPVLETAGFLTLLSVYDRVAYANEVQDGKKVYSSTLSSTWDHLRRQTWVHDQDPFNVNQFEHPYQGATMYGLARSSGHRFWTSLIHANAGSFIWKMAGETDPPSINDMITTGQAGSLLGEALYRMSDLVLRDAHGAKPHRLHETLAALLSPPSAVNRRAFGERFRSQLSDTTPITSWQLRLGATADALSRDYSAPVSLLRRDATAEFWMSYGLPGLPGYDYARPLDYFDFQMSFLSNAANPVESVMIRGLLIGRQTAQLAHSRGIWGLYGSYDYISPYLFRVSSTALSLGTTRQYWLTPGLALQGSMLGGVGYGAAGSTSTIPSTPTNAAIRDYHFGVTPQALATIRLIASDRVMLDLAAREYYVSGLGSDDIRGSETIFRGNVGFNVRIVGGHALGARFVSSTRDARYGKLSNKKLSEGTLTFAYSFLGHARFGAVKW